MSLAGYEWVFLRTVPGSITPPTRLQFADVGANLAKRLLGANESRKGIILQNLGPGTIFLGVDSTLAVPLGFQLPAGWLAIDEPPFVHIGEWWAYSDNAATLAALSSIGSVG